MLNCVLMVLHMKHSPFSDNCSCFQNISSLIASNGVLLSDISVALFLHIQINSPWNLCLSEPATATATDCSISQRGTHPTSETSSPPAPA